MCERMYLVIKSIINKGGVHEDYVLKKGDIIKLGRAKFLVRDINIVSAHEQIQKKRPLTTNNHSKKNQMLSLKKCLSSTLSWRAHLK